MTTPASLPADAHGLRVVALRAAIEGRATILDVHTLGTEQVVLLLADDASGRHELHLLLHGPRLCFWLEPAARGTSPVGAGFSDWLRRHLAGARITRVSEGESRRILRLDVALASTGRETPERGFTPPAPDAIAALVLDPLPNACRLLILDAQGRVTQRYPPTTHAKPLGRGAPGSLYAEPAAPGATGLKHEHRLRSTPVSAGLGDSPATLSAARGLGLARIRLVRASECARQVRKILRTELTRLTRLQARLAVELEEARGGGHWRRQAEALLAHAQRVPKGAKQVTLEDPSHPGQKLTIPLDPKLNFSQNAKQLFRRAARLERSLPLREKQAASCDALITAIEGWLTLPALAEHPENLGEPHEDAVAGITMSADRTAADLRAAHRDARAHLAALESGLRHRWQSLLTRWRGALASLDQPIDRAGYDARRAASAKPVEAGTHPRRFVLAGDWEVLVGRSNQENDVLTHKLAKPTDLWFHARGAAGSHVVLRCAGRGSKPPKAILEEVAAIAAYFSKARTSSMAAVAYAEKRYVRKPRGAKPGLAVCAREKVLMVKPRLPPAQQPGLC
jgi:hypothetical protein